MKGHQFVIFMTIFLAVYLAGNFYVFIRGWQALPASSIIRSIYSTLFFIFASSFIIGEISERNGIFEHNQMLIITGSTWLAFLFYALLFIILIDTVKEVNYLLNFLPQDETLKTANIPLKLMIGVISITSVIIIAGFITACCPVIKIIDIQIDKQGGIESSLNIVVASDIHLGNIIGRNKFKFLVDTINSLDTDIVLFPGDFFDETLRPIVKDNMGGLVESIRSRYGVYAVTGNHEYIGGVTEAVNFMQKHKINVLRDEAIEINGSILLVGREDRIINRIAGVKRKNLEDILHGKNLNLPIILMDHQPSSIVDSLKNNVDLHISGHTHNGQLWPLNYITDTIFKITCGYTKVNNTNIYVSSGYGTWGPPVRTSGRPEIAVFQIRFKPKP